MRNFAKRLAAIVPFFAVAGAAGATEMQPRALTLDVSEVGDRVEVQLIANSLTTQQVEFELELTGNSHARHSGSTSVAAGSRSVLSTLRSNGGASWCATALVKEASGAEYTLKAGDCD